jgi:hypothetical protein
VGTSSTHTGTEHRSGNLLRIVRKEKWKQIMKNDIAKWKQLSQKWKQIMQNDITKVETNYEK